MFPLARKVQKETSTKSAPLIMLFLLLSSSYSKPKHFCSMMMVMLQNLLTTTVLKQKYRFSWTQSHHPLHVLIACILSCGPLSICLSSTFPQENTLFVLSFLLRTTLLICMAITVSCCQVFDLGIWG